MSKDDRKAETSGFSLRLRMWRKRGSAPESPGGAKTFRQEAEGRQAGLVREFWDFLKHNKKWWLAPIVIVILIIGLLVVLSGSGVGAFMYTIF
jgi:hypothetical protein